MSNIGPTRGVTTGQGMCDLLLKEAKVALMPSSSFLLADSDLTTRFCYVNFEVKASV